LVLRRLVFRLRHAWAVPGLGVVRHRSPDSGLAPLMLVDRRLVNREPRQRLVLIQSPRAITAAIGTRDEDHTMSQHQPGGSCMGPESSDRGRAQV
jgi:hypothetical protein